ncbi:hypothetical protein [Bifidobacterium pseudolongum]|uniref:hypothetical protein n=1 Tax=Bifidobacterium pseudolongum TaxID=1694 RepID=UPI00101EAA48|nr:hypothetical protein [Bifidobacterium pseudolongum]RYQ70387.1 hypothetical protein PG2103B_0349 [Bifidobacterium pseudolongum subsp. globosum]
MSATGNATKNESAGLVPAPRFSEPRTIMHNGSFHIDSLMNAVEAGFGIVVEVKGYGGRKLLGALQHTPTPPTAAYSPERLRALADYARHGFADFLEECADRWEQLGDGSDASAALRLTEAGHKDGRGRQ